MFLQTMFLHTLVHIGTIQDMKMFLQTMFLHTLVHIGTVQDMILLKLVPLGDSPTITFTTAAPVSQVSCIQTMILHTLVHLGDSPTPAE